MPDAKARNAEEQQRMWALSCKLVGEALDTIPPSDSPLDVPVETPRISKWLKATMLGEVLGFTSTAMIAFVALAFFRHPENVLGRIVALVIMTAAGVV